ATELGLFIPDEHVAAQLSVPRTGQVACRWAIAFRLKNMPGAACIATSTAGNQQILEEHHWPGNLHDARPGRLCGNANSDRIRQAPQISRLLRVTMAAAAPREAP